MKKPWIIAASAGLLLGGLLALNAAAQRAEDGGFGRFARRERVVQRLRGRLAARAARLRAVGRALDLTKAQEEQALSIAQAAEPLVRDLRKEIARELVGSRAQDREARRARVKELVQGAFHQLEPEVRALMATFTPEQRARIEALAKKRGLALDDERLARGLAFLLSRPMAAPLLEARLGR